MDRFFARVGSLATVDGVRHDGCLAEHLEFHDACIDRQRNRQGVLLCRPSVRLGTVLIQGTEPPLPINHRRLLGEARELVIPAPFAKGGHESLIRFPDLTLHGSASHPSTHAIRRTQACGFPSGMDRIYVMAEGQIAEAVTHEELIADRGISMEPFTLQAASVSERGGRSAGTGRAARVPVE